MTRFPWFVIRFGLGFAWLSMTYLTPAAAPEPAREAVEPLLKSLTFHADFNGTIDGRRGKGDLKLYTIMRSNPEVVVQAGMHTDQKTRLEAGSGLSGDALRFTARDARWLFYKAAHNLPYSASDWSGTVSLWLKVDPQRELAPGYCDPIQITPNTWNDAAFFVDFDKEGDPRDFRLGVFPDLKAWNPDQRDVNGIPESERPLVKVANPPFQGDRWTHVAFTWTRFNTGDTSGRATFYLNGVSQGELTGWNQTFTWPDQKENRIMIGLNYIGLLDELSCFNRALTADEVKMLFDLKGDLGEHAP